MDHFSCNVGMKVLLVVVIDSVDLRLLDKALYYLFLSYAELECPMNSCILF